MAMPWEVFASYLAIDGSQENYQGTTTYAQVNTDGPGVTLNLRDQPTTGSQVLAEVPSDPAARAASGIGVVLCAVSGPQRLSAEPVPDLLGRRARGGGRGAQEAEVAPDESTMLPAVVQATADEEGPGVRRGLRGRHVLGHWKTASAWRSSRP